MDNLGSRQSDRRPRGLRAIRAKLCFRQILEVSAWAQSSRSSRRSCSGKPSPGRSTQRPTLSTTPSEVSPTECAAYIRNAGTLPCERKTRQAPRPAPCRSGGCIRAGRRTCGAARCAGRRRAAAGRGRAAVLAVVLQHALRDFLVVRIVAEPARGQGQRAHQRRGVVAARRDRPASSPAPWARRGRRSRPRPRPAICVGVEALGAGRHLDARRQRDRRVSFWCQAFWLR